MGQEQRRQRRPASEMLAHLAELADDLFGDDEQDEKETYVTKHMQKMGYRARVTFEDADDDENGNDSGSFTTALFGNGGGRQRRDVGGRGGRRDRGDDGFGSGQYRNRG